MTSIVVVLTSLITISALYADNWVGAKSQDQFESGWLSASTYRHMTCGNFVNKMDSYSDSTRQYWTEIKGAKWRYLEGDGEGYGYGIDNVDIYMNCSHGGISGNSFTIAMWDENDLVYSSQMRLGDDGRGLSIYTSYDCGQMNPSSGWSTRWSYLFKGGLRYASAFWGSSYNSEDTQYFGRHYAENLHNGLSLKYAWLNAMDDYAGNTPAVMATGISSSSCDSRLSNMNWSNYKNYERYRDNRITNYCMVRRQG